MKPLIVYLNQKQIDTILHSLDKGKNESYRKRQLLQNQSVRAAIYKSIVVEEKRIAKAEGK